MRSYDFSWEAGCQRVSWNSFETHFLFPTTHTQNKPGAENVELRPNVEYHTTGRIGFGQLELVKDSWLALRWTFEMLCFSMSPVIDQTWILSEKLKCRSILQESCHSDSAEKSSHQSCTYCSRMVCCSRFLCCSRMSDVADRLAALEAELRETKSVIAHNIDAFFLMTVSIVIYCELQFATNDFCCFRKTSPTCPHLYLSQTHTKSVPLSNKLAPWWNTTSKWKAQTRQFVVWAAVCRTCPQLHLESAHFDCNENFGQAHRVSSAEILTVLCPRQTSEVQVLCELWYRRQLVPVDLFFLEVQNVWLDLISFYMSRNGPRVFRRSP